MARLAAQSQWAAQIVALADPAEVARQRGEAALGIGKDRQFADHGDLLAQCPGLDAAIVATEVHTHAQITCDCLQAGVPVYLEKPMTRTIEEAHQVVAAARSAEVPLMVGMNLRFAPFYRRLKELVADGAVGEVISVEWKEVLSPGAWADGYCRASWYSRKSEVGGWLLEKSCHDIDQINWLMHPPCARVASFGSRSHFVPRDDVPERCTDGCPVADECVYECHKLHPDGTASLPEYVPPERWDLCVYHCGSDLVDRQVALLEYEDGATAAFSLLPAGNRWERLMRICGSDATIRASDALQEIHICAHDRADPVVEQLTTGRGGHGGADSRAMAAFLRLLDDPSQPSEISLEEGLESMLGAGGIELACQEKRVVELGPLRVAAPQAGEPE